jgi:chemotaxis protein CheY-P-specific phosphatase CheC
MNRPTSELITGVVVDTLEKLAFLFALPQEEKLLEEPAEPLETVEVSFSGSCSGRMQFGLSASVMAELAGNMLGAVDGAALAIEEQRDALKELANVICGNLLPAIGGREAEFSIGTPRILGAALALPLGPGAVESRLSVECGICRAGIELAGGFGAAPERPSARDLKGRME